MPRNINDELITELKKTNVPDGHQYITVYDDKDAGFLVRKSVSGIISFAIEFKDVKGQRKTVKIGKQGMKPSVARCVATSLLRQKLKDRRLKALHPNELVEVSVNDSVVAIAEKDVADIASGFFDNKEKQSININEVTEIPESTEVVIPNTVIPDEDVETQQGTDDKNEIASDDYILDDVEEPKVERTAAERIFDEQLDPLSKAIFKTKGIGSESDEKFRSEIFAKLLQKDVEAIAEKYRNIYEESKSKFPKHQQGRAITEANKYLLQLTMQNKQKDSDMNNKVVDLSNKIKEKEEIIRQRN